MDHAWRYFELHAQQRMTVFNFFLAIAGLLAAGIGACLQEGKSFFFLATALGIFLTLVSFIFWKLDQRVSMLIKNSEVILEKLEKHANNFHAGLFCEDKKFQNGSIFNIFSTWSYGRCFRVSFFAVGLLGAGSAVLPWFIDLPVK